MPGKARGTLPAASQGALRVRGRHTQFCRGGKSGSLSLRGDTFIPKGQIRGSGKKAGLGRKEPPVIARVRREKN